MNKIRLTKKLLKKLIQDKKDYKQIAAETGWSKTTVRNKAISFGLVKPKKYKELKRLVTDKTLIRLRVKKGMTYEQIQEETGGTLTSINQRCVSLNINRKTWTLSFIDKQVGNLTVTIGVNKFQTQKTVMKVLDKIIKNKHWKSKMMNVVDL